MKILKVYFQFLISINKLPSHKGNRIINKKTLKFFSEGAITNSARHD